MAILDSLVNKTYSVDSQYYGAGYLSASFDLSTFAINSITTKALSIAGTGAVSGASEKMLIKSVDDSSNQISVDFYVSDPAAGSLLTLYVEGYDAATGSILIGPSPMLIAAQAASGTLPVHNGQGGILSSSAISGSTITFAGLVSSTVVTVPTATPTPTPTPPSTASSGGSAAASPVYRFFDNTFGTHLFTQSLAEAQQIIATRKDLSQETNGFGSVSPTNPSAVPVYRFFESNGTHFFTANTAEFQGLSTPGSGSYRADLSYEASSTFYEDSTQQPGDVPVYRLFDATHGTQFLTGSQTEYQGLTTPGSGTYRPDLSAEGIAFYAPAGSFHT